MKRFVCKNKSIIYIALLLVLMTAVFTMYRNNSIFTLTNVNYEVMLDKQRLLMTEMFNRFAVKINGHCDLEVRDELISTVINNPVLYGITFLRYSKPYCSSHPDKIFNTTSFTSEMSGNNHGVISNYIDIDKEFSIQVEVIPSINQHDYILAFMTRRGDGYDHLNDQDFRQHVSSIEQSVSTLHDRGAWSSLLSSDVIIVLMVVSVFIVVFLWLCGGHYKLACMYEKYRLNKAMAHDELRPFIQPVVTSADGRIIGGEVLLRWLHPQRGIVYPADFINAAERSGLIVNITRQLFVRVKEELLEIVSHLPTGFKIGFNISPRHLEDSRLVQDCVDFIGSFKPDSIVMVLEITEREAIVYSDTLYANIHALRQAGIKLAMDDYGTGNSTLQSIQKIPFDYIKIDKAFIDLVATDKMSLNILKNIISLAESINAKTVAEGVETAEQASLLAYHGVHFQQGWLWSKAMPISHIISLSRLRS